MISRCSHLNDQPLAMNRAARSSSSSGCVGAQPLRAEVARRADQMLAEVPAPDAIHDHARGQRRGVGEDLLAKLQTAGAVVEVGIGPSRARAGIRAAPDRRASSDCRRDTAADRAERPASRRRTSGPAPTSLNTGRRRRPSSGTAPSDRSASAARRPPPAFCARVRVRNQIGRQRFACRRARARAS